MAKTGALLASCLGAVALLAAGCGGSGTGSASGTVGTTTSNGQGGVAGAQANLGSARAQIVLGRIQTTLSRRIRQLAHMRNLRQLNRAALQASGQLQREAARVRQLNVPPSAVQQQQDLASSLQALASDIDSVRLNAKAGDVSGTVQALTSLSSVATVRRSLQRLRQALRNAHASAGGSVTASTPMTTTSASTTTGG